jgi:hypothetical protein
MTRTSDETTSERAERLPGDHTRIQLPPDAWDELVAIMDREAKPNRKLAKLFSRRSAAKAPAIRLHFAFCSCRRTESASRAPSA